MEEKKRKRVSSKLSIAVNVQGGIQLSVNKGCSFSILCVVFSNLIAQVDFCYSGSINANHFPGVVRDAL